MPFAVPLLLTPGMLLNVCWRPLLRLLPLLAPLLLVLLTPLLLVLLTPLLLVLLTPLLLVLLTPLLLVLLTPLLLVMLTPLLLVMLTLLLLTPLLKLALSSCAVVEGGLVGVGEASTESSAEAPFASTCSTITFKVCLMAAYLHV